MENDNPNLRHFAREMRKEPTPAERALWKVLRNRRLAGFKFRRQVTFGPYILDNYCARAKLVVETDGDTHATPDTAEEKPAKKTRAKKADAEPAEAEAAEVEVAGAETAEA